MAHRLRTSALVIISTTLLQTSEMKNISATDSEEVPKIRLIEPDPMRKNVVCLCERLQDGAFYGRYNIIYFVLKPGFYQAQNKSK